MFVSDVQHSDSVFITHTHTRILFQILFPYRLLQNIEYSSLRYTVGPCWLSTLCIVPGSSPVGSRVIRRWGRGWRPWKNTYLITDREGLEMDSVVGRLVEKRRLNNLGYVE